MTILQIHFNIVAVYLQSSVHSVYTATILSYKLYLYCTSVWVTLSAHCACFIVYNLRTQKLKIVALIPEQNVATTVPRVSGGIYGLFSTWQPVRSSISMYVAWVQPTITLMDLQISDYRLSVTYKNILLLFLPDKSTTTRQMDLTSRLRKFLSTRALARTFQKFANQGTNHSKWAKSGPGFPKIGPNRGPDLPNWAKLGPELLKMGQIGARTPPPPIWTKSGPGPPKMDRIGARSPQKWTK